MTKGGGVPQESSRTRTIERLRGGLIVSCQAYPGEPLDTLGVMPLFAQAVVRGGAAAVRMQGIDNIRGAVTGVDVPVIGLVKEGASGVYITPTLELAVAVAQAGADIVALDGTDRSRPDGLNLKETVRGLRDAHSDVLVMADCDCLASARTAVEAGVDIVGTTLAGYTEGRARSSGPDLELIDEVAAVFPSIPVIAEGRVRSPNDVRAALAAGAWAVVVGTAITHPSTITADFALTATPRGCAADSVDWARRNV